VTALGQNANWIAIDWGTTHLRAYAMQGTQVLDRAQSDAGMGALSPDQFAPTLDAILKGWALPHNIPVIACGMVGSRQGWVEAPYRSAPCPPLDRALTPVPERPSVRIIPGIRQTAPADVMRGEETQIAGFLSLNAGWDGVLCLPGTHTKWVELSAGEIVSFQTFMTGELYALLSNHSVLRHSLGSGGWDDAAFSAAVSDSLSKPESLAARLFGLRAADLLNGTQAAVTRAQLSGLLIGAELAAARPYWLGRQIAIVGNGAQSQAYATGLALQGVVATVADADRMTLAGLTAAYRTRQEDPK
jgi:2-dehydro-3-deoxygalactonokinase